MDPANHSTSQSNSSAQSSLPGIANVSPRREGGQPSALTGPAETAQQPLDSRMDTDEDSEMPGLQNVSGIHDDMPGLQDVSDSSDDEDEDDSHDVEMHPPSTSSIDPPSSLPSSSSHPESSTRTNGNRRTRVEEDDDHERDRRHPSQRASSRAASNNDQPAPSMSVFRIHMMSSNGEPIGPPVTVQHPMNAAADPNPGNNDTTTPSIPATNATPLPNPTTGFPHPHTFLNFQAPTFGGNAPGGGIVFGGLMSIPLRGMGNQDAPEGQPPAAPAVGGANNNNPPPHGLAPTGDAAIDELLSAVGLQLNQSFASLGAIPININLANLAFGLEEKEDPERAKKLVQGLEDVPVGLVKRLVRVGGTGGGMGEDENKGGDAGCAICWDNLLDAEGEGFGKPEPAAASASDEANAESSSSKPETSQPRIVSLPCAHVFHADCLIPWFSRPRQTTCPTCRFNIDPDNLTYVSAARRERERRAAQDAARAANPDARAADAPAPEANANSNPAAPGGNPQNPDLPANDPLRGLRFGPSITMDMLFGFPLDQPGAGPPPPAEAGQVGQANQAANGEAEPVDGAGDAQAPPPLENARDVLQRASERRMRVLQAMARGSIFSPTPPGANAQNEGLDQEADEHQDTPAERPHRASSAPPPSTAPLPRASQSAQQGAAGPASPPPPPVQPGATSPRGTQLPPFLPNLFNNPTGAAGHTQFLSGTGRTINEALTQALGSLLTQLETGLNPPPAPRQPAAPQQGEQQGGPASGVPAPAPAPAEGGEPAAAPAPAPPAAGPAPTVAAGAPGVHAFRPPTQPNNAGPLPNAPPFRFLPFPFPFPGEPTGQRSDPNRPKPVWTLPAAPGPTLRQRVERREREAGLRCYDMSCGIGPSDEEPELSDTMKQLSIRGTDGAEVCVHRFHGACLVSAERVAMAARSAELVYKDGSVEVSCPVCRGTGSVTQEEWNEGVATLA